MKYDYVYMVLICLSFFPLTFISYDLLMESNTEWTYSAFVILTLFSFIMWVIVDISVQFNKHTLRISKFEKMLITFSYIFLLCELYFNSANYDHDGFYIAVHFVLLIIYVLYFLRTARG